MTEQKPTTADVGPEPRKADQGVQSEPWQRRGYTHHVELKSTGLARNSEVFVDGAGPLRVRAVDVHADVYDEPVQVTLHLPLPSLLVDIEHAQVVALCNGMDVELMVADLEHAVGIVPTLPDLLEVRWQAALEAARRILATLHEHQRREGTEDA